MVNDNGQLYTIEGLAAGLIMIATAYIVLGSTIVYTPGDTHIADMQLETLGNDVLRMMDTPRQVNGTGALTLILIGNQSEAFNETTFKSLFLTYSNATAARHEDDLQFNAYVSYRNETSDVAQYYLTGSRTQTGQEHAVRVTKWVEVDNRGKTNPKLEGRHQLVLVEVLLWRA